METERYVRKPSYVDAVRITEDNMISVAAWCDMAEIVEALMDPDGLITYYIQARVKHPMTPRQSRGYVGDWVLRKDNGEWMVFTHKAFQRSFDKHVGIFDEFYMIPSSEDDHPTIPGLTTE